MSPVRILVTGEMLVGQGYRSIDAVMREVIRQSKEEIQFATFLLTSAAIVDQLERAATRGVHVSIIVNRIEKVPSPIRRRLIELSERYPHFSLLEFPNAYGSQLHAKVMVSDRRVAIVGSANLTHSAMLANHEVAVLLDGEPAGELAQLVDRIAAGSLKSSRSVLRGAE